MPLPGDKLNKIGKAILQCQICKFYAPLVGLRRLERELEMAVRDSAIKIFDTNNTNYTKNLPLIREIRAIRVSFLIY